MSSVRPVFAALLLSALVAPVAAQVPAADGAAPTRAGRMYAMMSEAGQETMLAAMRGIESRTARLAVNAARDRMLALLDAERLDPMALRRAMDDEQSTSAALRDRQQAALFAAYQQLSVGDRRAFVAYARTVREQMRTRNATDRQRRIGAATGLAPLPPR